MTLDKILEIAGFLTGLLYLYWEYHANPRMWIAGLVMPFISMWVYFTKGLYADFAMNIYYLLMAVYGYVAWTFNFSRKQKESLPIRHINLRTLAGTAVAFCAVYTALAAWLILGTDSTVPYYDAFTTALSIVATWMLARKYIEQWIAWILVDSVCVWLYIYKGIYFYAALYLVYTVIAFFGYFKWKKLMIAGKKI
ncbi:MAG: nicotinamide riboside transporter PnuC [Paramuribaculum sp.]|nr:nicotinamide riboside transporter PnuC [Paramuribaculum sp.]